MTIEPRSERRRGLFVLQLPRAGDYEAATTRKKEMKEMWRFFLKNENTVNGVWDLAKKRQNVSTLIFFFLRGRWLLLNVCAHG